MHWKACLILALLTCCGVAGSSVAPEDIVLTNGLVEVTVSPRLFTVLGLRTLEGAHWVGVTALSQQERAGKDWVDPGGITTDIIPFVQDAAVRRGPGTVVSHEDLSLVMEGPVSEELGLRLRKEVRLASASPVVTYTVTAVSTVETPRKLALRNTARLVPRVTLRIDKRDGSLRALGEDQKPGLAVVNSLRWWMVPIPPTGEVKQLVLGAYVPKVTLRRGREEWGRRLLPLPADKTAVPNLSTLVCVLDTATESYGAAFQGATQTLTRETPVTLVEEWTLKQ